MTMLLFFHYAETPTCKQENVGNVEWPKTAVGITAKKPCPGNATGKLPLNYRKIIALIIQDI